MHLRSYARVHKSEFYETHKFTYCSFVLGMPTGDSAGVFGWEGAKVKNQSLFENQMKVLHDTMFTFYFILLSHFPIFLGLGPRPRPQSGRPLWNLGRGPGPKHVEKCENGMKCT